ncbi:hypothetical protein OH76DRAFT_1420683 [Lentinus brumalis]|uniref:Uncharacterized protein n=1 Tax=Lentinus brumalis TaxID=2498619 RepID=A0A371CZG2_9APHY|nr:hypothetical protein OH76DRAFT_1420683 [Polyporus brumalis]
MSILNVQYQVSDARSEPIAARRASSSRPRPQSLVSASWHRESPMGWPWHTSDGRCMTWWHAEKAGILRSRNPWCQWVLRGSRRERPSADVDDGKPVAKRLRTRVAKPKPPARPPRKSTRLRKSANTAAPAPAKDLGGAVEDATGGCGESVDVDVVVDVETVEETKATARRKATSARKRLAAKKSAARATPKQTVAPVPQEAPSQPAPSSWRRVDNPASSPSSSDLVIASSLLMLASVPAAASSAPTTAVEIPVEGSTCVNTPPVAAEQPPIELTKVDAKLAALAKASGRRSTIVRRGDLWSIRITTDSSFRN